jgi:hypothetical protein
MNDDAGKRHEPYRIEREGYAFRLERPEVATLKALPEFEGREEPAVADEFLRFRADRWAENLSDAGAPPGEVSVRLDRHQRRAHLVRGEKVLFTAEL